MTQSSAGEGPSAGRRMIRRPRLTQLLAESDSRVLLLTAPAGYGKTTLAREWLASVPGEHAWFQVTEASRDIAALALGIASATSSVVPKAGEELRAWLRTSPDPDAHAEALAKALADDLSHWPSDAWLVMDDYHLLNESEIAEQFVALLLAQTELSVLIATRSRPSWVTAKRLLYGDVTEFGRTVLAMTPGEAALTLSDSHREMPGLVALAEGWPAVIGLAALLRGPLPPGGAEIPETLHEFFAEELFQGLRDELRRALAQLALAPVLDDHLLRALFGADGRTFVEEGYRNGFLSKSEGGYEMHPLLRQFLRVKLAEFGKATMHDTARIVGTSYVDQGRWDEASAIAIEFEQVNLLLRILSEALDSVLSEGRVATVKRWLEAVQELAPTAPIVRLAAIEIAFRTGNLEIARPKALQLAHAIPDNDPLASRIYLRAGQIAHLEDRRDEALQWLSAAKKHAMTPPDLRRSAWTRFVTLTDFEAPEEAAKALKEFQDLPPLDGDDLLRASQGHLQFAMRWGGLTKAFDALADPLDLVERSGDPIVRTGFLQTYGTALSLLARYEESGEISDRQLEEANRFGLEWVLPHGLEMRAIADFGRREFRQSLRTLSKARRLAAEQSNVHSQLNSLVLTARIFICRGDPARALKVLQTRDPRRTSPGMEGDYLATQAYAFACSGLRDEADHALLASEAATDHVEALILRGFARTITKQPDSQEVWIDPSLLGVALAKVLETGNFDGFVVAYRGCPEILLRLRDVADVDLEPFTSILRRWDPALARTIGLSPVLRSVREPGLTQREQEVLSLIRDGLSNREIARTLWISESTVKVHVHNVLGKLGARSRTEAAALSIEQHEDLPN